MLLYNADVDAAERNFVPTDEEEEAEFDGEEDIDPPGSFFDLRQRTLVGMDPMPAFRIAALGVIRKMRFNHKGSIWYGEAEDALGRFFRVLDAESQKFASLHETLRDAAEKKPGSSGAIAPCAQAILQEAMREIAVVLLACGQMQRRALDLKVSAQRVISECRHGSPPLVSFSKYADFLEEALAVCDQLKRKHEELHQQRMRAMASSADARVTVSGTGDKFSPPGRTGAFASSSRSRSGRYSRSSSRRSVTPEGDPI